jgi:hypothetical protein
MSALRAACGLYLDPHTRRVLVDERARWLAANATTVPPAPPPRPAPRGRRIPRTGIGDDQIIAAVREWPSLAAAGRALGLSRQAVSTRLTTLEAEGTLPRDLADELAARRRA